jgi:hypothetical protein
MPGGGSSCSGLTGVERVVYETAILSNSEMKSYLLYPWGGGWGGVV